MALGAVLSGFFLSVYGFIFACCRALGRICTVGAMRFIFNGCGVSFYQLVTQTMDRTRLVPVAVAHVGYSLGGQESA